MKRHNDLQKILLDNGFHILTGEACGISMRLLVELDPTAEEIYTEFTGGCTPTHPGMNTWDWKTCFMIREQIQPLAIYCLLRAGAKVVTNIVDQKRFINTLVEYESTEEAILQTENHRHIYPEGKVFSWSAKGTARNGLVNRHEFSGRVE